MRTLQHLPYLGSYISVDITTPDTRSEQKTLQDLTRWFTQMEKTFSPEVRSSELERIRRGKQSIIQASDTLTEVLWLAQDVNMDGGDLDVLEVAYGWGIEKISQQLERNHTPYLLQGENWSVRSPAKTYTLHLTDDTQKAHTLTLSGARCTHQDALESGGTLLVTGSDFTLVHAHAGIARKEGLTHIENIPGLEAVLLTSPRQHTSTWNIPAQPGTRYAHH